MKQPKKRLMLYSVSLIFILMIPAWYLMKMYLETRKMSPLATQQIKSDVYAIKNTNVNMFLIQGDDTYIAIDAGSDLKMVEREMQKLAIDPLKVSAVFLTHSDSDHVVALGLFTNAKIYISKAEEQMIKGQTSRYAVIKNKNISNYELLEDHQTMNFPGLKVGCILTPGHTPGSMSFVINDIYLFVGDAMSMTNGEAGLYYHLFNVDSETAEKSIRKLADLQKIQYIFTAHYGFSDDLDKVFGSYRNK